MANTISYEDVISIQKSYQVDPELFFEQVLGVQKQFLWWAPKKILRAIANNKKVAVKSGHGVSKSWTFGRIPLWWLSSYGPLAKVVTTAPTFSQVERILWSELHAAYNNCLRPLGGKLNKTDLTFNPEWFGIGYSTDEEQRFQGVHSPNLLVLFDEAGGIKPAIYNGARGLATGENSRWACIGNPIQANGDFYDMFKPDSGWDKITISCLDTPNYIIGREESIGVDECCKLVKDYKSYRDLGLVKIPGLTDYETVEGWRKEWGEDSPLWYAKCLGEFPVESSNTLIALKWVEDARSRIIDLYQLLGVHKDQRFFGVDVARYGVCETIITCYDGYNMLYQKSFSKRSTVEVAGFVIDCLREEKNPEAPIAIDDSVTGDVPVVIRRQKQFIDIVPIMSLHKQSNIYYNCFKGIEILSQDGWTDIIWSKRHKVNKKGYDIITGSGRTKVTEDHSLIKDRLKIKPNDLNIGDLIDIKQPEINNKLDSMTKDFAWLVGFFVAEGTCKQQNKSNGGFILQITNFDNKKLLKAKKILEDGFCKNVMISKDRITTSGFSYKWFYEYCYSINYFDNNKIIKFKKVPIQILNANEELKKSFLEGYMSGDGHINKHEEKSDSKELLISAGIQYIYYSLGYNTSVRTRNDKFNITTIAKLKYDKKSKKGRYSKFQFNEIKRKREFFIDDYVYDLETKSHTFVAGIGFLVHSNTGVGGGVTDILKEQGYNVIPVVLRSISDEPEKYFDLRTEIFCDLADKFQKGNISIKDPDTNRRLYDKLASQLCSLTYEMDRRARKKVTPKERIISEMIKQHGQGESPDRADSLSLAVYASKNRTRRNRRIKNPHTKIFAGAKSGAGGY